MNEAFEAWFQGGANKQKLERINGGYKLSSAHLSWIAWQAASQHYEAKLTEMQAGLDKARELLGYAREDVNECYQNILPNAGYASFDRKIEDYKTQLAEIDAFLAKDK